MYLSNNSNILKGLNQEEISMLFELTNAYKKTFQKNDVEVFSSKDNMTVGIVQKGKIDLQLHDDFMHKIVLETVTCGESFNNINFTNNNDKTKLCIRAIKDSTIIFLNCKNIIKNFNSDNSAHQKIYQNLLMMQSHKISKLSNNLLCLNRRTTIQKVAYYLYQTSLKNTSELFEIPYNRDELAAFLGVNRSALSREIAKLKALGILNYKKNKFEIISNDLLFEIISK